MNSAMSSSSVTHRYPLPPMDQSRRTLLRYEDRVFVAYNTTSLPLVVSREATGFVGHSLPLEMGCDLMNASYLPEVKWASNKYPFNGWSLHRPTYEGELLGRLSVPFDRFPVIKTGNFWTLDERLRKSWKDLEERLGNLIRQLMRILPDSSMKFLGSLRHSAILRRII